MSDRFWVGENGPVEVAHYSVLHLRGPVCGMAALRAMFPDGKANELNFVLFSTSGIHGSYITIEEAATRISKRLNKIPSFMQITFLVVHPRLVCLRYGLCVPETKDDIIFLKMLRESSKEAVADMR